MVKSFGLWGPVAQCSLSRLTGILATRLRQPKTITINQIVFDPQLQGHYVLEDVFNFAVCVYVIMCMCKIAGFCTFAYVARTTPPSMATATFEHFDRLIHECFSECTGVNTTKQSWLQAELSPHRGGLGLRSLSHHSTAAYI